MDAVFVASRRFLQRIYVSQMRHALGSGTVVQADHRAEGRDLPRGEDVAEVEEPGEDVGRRIERKKVFSEGVG